MKKQVAATLFSLLIAAMSVAANACPKDTHPVGGEGPHHKGGTCEPN